MDKSFFTYKGFPLVRHEDVIYYGNMSDDYVVMLKILNKKKVCTRLWISQMHGFQELLNIKKKDA